MKNENKLNSMLAEFFDDIMSCPTGGEINSDASEVLDENTVILHCWDGRRFQLSLKEQPSGCSYNAATGLPEEKT